MAIATSPPHSSCHLLRGARVLTMDGARNKTSPERGQVGVPLADARGSSDATNLGALDNADILVNQGIVQKISIGLPPPPGAQVIDAAGRVVMPAFVDCHTHLCWTGSRLDEWEMKRRGATYLEILAAGGGIMSTVRAVREASREELTEALLHRLRAVLKLGTTTIEIKSGYGLRTADELKMLRAISDAATQWPGTIVPTALIGHAIDSEAGSHERFVDQTIGETLDTVHAEFPGITIDAFCEQGAWTLNDCMRLFEKARTLGHPIRVHADQFNSLGMVREAIRLGARSVDHLEASTPQDLAALAESDTFGVILPCCGFHLDNRYAKPRMFLDHRAAHVDGSGRGGRLCVATNSNPGSAPCFSMPMVMALAVRQCGLSPAEAIAAATVNPAQLLGFSERGVVAEGLRADLLLLETSDERDLVYQFGSPPIAMIMCGGDIIHG